MAVKAPHFLLTAQCRKGKRTGDWRFALQSPAGQRLLEVEESEPQVGGERLELLAVVRGLEALEQPSRVTLLTESSYVTRGMKYGLDDWRSNNWQWESHGKMVPMKNGDLWRRIDRALRYHEVQCKFHRFDAPHNDKATAAGRDFLPLPREGRGEGPAVEHRTAKSALATDAPKSNSFDRRRIIPAVVRRIKESVSSLYLRLAQLGSGLLPQPWLNK
jgi:ribonuclease HI